LEDSKSSCFPSLEPREERPVTYIQMRPPPAAALKGNYSVSQKRRAALTQTNHVNAPQARSGSSYAFSGANALAAKLVAAALACRASSACPCTSCECASIPSATLTHSRFPFLLACVDAALALLSACSPTTFSNS